MKHLMFAVTGLAALFGMSVSAGDVAWTGSGANSDWGTSANWAGGIPPDTSDVPVFKSEADGVTSVLSADWAVGGFNMRVTTPASPAYAAMSHSIDLGGHMLSVEGDFYLANHLYDPNNAVSELDRYARDTWLTIGNGTLRIGSDSQPRKLSIAELNNDKCYASLAFVSPSTFDAFLSGLYIGTGYCSGGDGVLDLRQADIRRGDDIGLFRTGVLQLGGSGWGSAPRTNTVEVLFGSSLKKLQIDQALSLADGQIASAYIGQWNGDGIAPMPDGVDIQIGSESQRASISIGNCGWSAISGFFVPGEGGAFTGYVSTLSMGQYLGGGNSFCDAVMDLRAMDSAYLDVESATIGKSAASNCRGTGLLGLPAGEAVFGSLSVGDDFATGLVALDGATLRVTDSLAVGASGVVSNNVLGASSGLDFAAGATISVGGSIRIVFAQPDASNGANGVYWGLRAAGDRRVALSELQAQGRLSWDDSQIPGTANIFYDAATDCSYVAHRANGEWGATVIAKSLEVEVKPGVATDIVLGLGDIDASPSGQNPESRMLSCTTGSVASDGSSVAFNGALLVADAEPVVHTVTLTYVKGGTETSSDATITIHPLATPVETALVWEGGASFEFMDRHEWLWGDNWQGGAAPAVTTPATITFANAGDGTNVVECDRQVGGLTVLADDKRHVFDLSGNTLSVSGGALAVGSVSYATQATFTNGTLSIAGGDCSVLSKSNMRSELCLAGMTLGIDARDIILNTTSDPESGTSVIDLRGASFTNGTLAANSIQMNRAYNEIWLDSTTFLTNIVLGSSLVMGYGYWSGNALMGDPANSYRLPANVSFSIGSPESAAGTLWIGHGYVGGDVALVASEGGSFSAYVSDVCVGYSNSGNLDLHAMDSVEIRTPVFTVGSAGSSAYGGGAVSLPKGTVETGLLQIGMKQADSSLDLYGTDFLVTDALTNGVHYVSWDNHPGDVNAAIRVHLAGESCGLRIAAGVPMAFGANGTVQLDFATPPSSLPYYGMRLAGDRAEEIGDLVEAGTISWTGDEAVAARVRVFNFKGDTCIGIPPPGGTIFLLK